MNNLERVIKTFNEGHPWIVAKTDKHPNIVNMFETTGGVYKISLTEFIFDYGLCEVLWGDPCIDCRKTLDSNCTHYCVTHGFVHKTILSTLPPSDRLKYIVENSEVA